MMGPKDIRTPADVARWLKHHVEWSGESSRDMMLRAVDVLTVASEVTQQAKAFVAGLNDKTPVSVLPLVCAVEKLK